MKTRFRFLIGALISSLPLPVAWAQDIVNPNCNISQETSLQELTAQATIVVEGRAGKHRSFWNASHSAIYTATTITVYKVFKGSLQGDEVEIVTPGGTVGDEWQTRDDDPAVLPLSTNTVGLFMGVPTKQGAEGATLPASQVLDVVGKYEGFFRYSGVEPDPSAAFSACRRYRNVPVTLYTPIQMVVGKPYQTLRDFDIATYDRYASPASSAVGSASGVAAPEKKSADVSSQGPNGPVLRLTALPTISSLDTYQQTAGTFDNITITGSNFVDPVVPTQPPTVLFTNVERHANSAVDQYIPAPEENILSWTNTQIVVRVPSNYSRQVNGTFYNGVAGTGPVRVQTNGGISTPSATLDIPRAETNRDDPTLTANLRAYRQLRLTGRDAGGYQFRYGTTLFNTPQAVRAVQYSLLQWRCSTSINFGDDVMAAVPYDPNAPRDLVCNIEFVDQTGPLAATMVTIRGGSVCSQNGAHYTYQQYMDIEIDLNSDRNWNYDFNQNAQTDQLDFISALIHELGHCAALSHIDDATKVMYPVLNPGQTKRALSPEPELNGAGSVLGRSQTQYTCSQGVAYFPMLPLDGLTCQGGSPSVNLTDVFVDRCTPTPSTVSLTANGGTSYVWAGKEHFNNTNPTTATVTATTAPYTAIGVYSTRNGLGGTALVNIYFAENVHCPPDEGEISAMRTTAYPNPSTSDFTVDYPGTGTSDVEFSLYNSQGSSIRNFRYPRNNQRRTFPINGLKAGMYYLRIVENGRTQGTLRLVVQ